MATEMTCTNQLRWTDVMDDDDNPMASRASCGGLTWHYKLQQKWTHYDPETEISKVVWKDVPVEGEDDN